MSDYEVEKQKYIKDTRIACKYGTKCYQKNQAHRDKFKHPPEKPADVDARPNKRIRLDTQNDKEKIDVISSDSTEQSKEEAKVTEKEADNSVASNSYEASEALGFTPQTFETPDFIKEKFLVDMPEDFYQFWEFCKDIKAQSPENALKEIGLTLVGPYDVLAGKFYGVKEQQQDRYLIHWRYYYDPPEFQTVLKGDEKAGYHIGYFRDSPDEMPVYLASNCARKDGTFDTMGDNIFAAVNTYLEWLKKYGDPFKKMHVSKYQNKIRARSQELNLDLSENSEKMRNRDKRIITRTFSKMGIIIPYNRKTQVGYRGLSVSNKELRRLLTNVKNALPEQRRKFLSDLQHTITNANIATDECDFGTGIELGLDILAHGVDSLNHTARHVLATNYRLIDRESFAKIIEAHMKNRRNETNLSILQ